MHSHLDLYWSAGVLRWERIGGPARIPPYSCRARTSAQEEKADGSWLFRKRCDRRFAPSLRCFSIEASEATCFKQRQKTSSVKFHKRCRRRFAPSPSVKHDRRDAATLAFQLRYAHRRRELLAVEQASQMVPKALCAVFQVQMFGEDNDKLDATVTSVEEKNLPPPKNVPPSRMQTLRPHSTACHLSTPRLRAGTQSLLLHLHKRCIACFRRRVLTVMCSSIDGIVGIPADVAPSFPLSDRDSSRERSDKNLAPLKNLRPLRQSCAGLNQH